MHLGGIGLGIASSSADGARRNGSMRPNQIVFKPHVKSISIKCEETPEKPEYSPQKYWISSKLLHLDSPLKPLSRIEDRKAKAPLEPPEIELPDAVLDIGKAPLEQPTPELHEIDPPCSCSQEKKPEPKKRTPTVSAKDIMLSEYYTCITTHAPIPKMTHMFGDMILECNKKKAPPGAIEVSEPPDPEVPTDRFMSFCFYCNKKLQEDKDVFFCRDKTFCSFQCQCMEIFSCGLGDDFNRSLLEQAALQDDQSISGLPFFPS